MPRPLAALAVMLTLTAPVPAQQPDVYANPGNLQVLPSDISPEELLEIMKSFALGMGVRCSHCHVGEEGQALTTFDFASDAKPAKQTARVMWDMMREINQVTLAALPESRREGIEVRCVTCHRGQDRPRLVEDILARITREEGVDAALAHYAELREREYGSHTYDFSPSALNQFAEQLAARGEFGSARKVLARNVEYHPDHFVTWFYHYRVAMMAGDTEAAVQALERAHALQPDQAFVKRQLEKLKGGAD